MEFFSRSMYSAKGQPKTIGNAPWAALCGYRRGALPGAGMWPAYLAAKTRRLNFPVLTCQAKAERFDARADDPGQQADDCGEWSDWKEALAKHEYHLLVPARSGRDAVLASTRLGRAGAE